MTFKTAVLFKCHSWDETIARSYERARAHARRSDVFILYDNSSGVCAVPEAIQASERMFFAPYRDIEALGLAWGSEQDNLGGYWYNGDYHQNLFILKHPEYDFICSVENDVAVLNDLDAVFDDMEARGIDAVYRPTMNRNEWWPHTGNCEGYYDTSQHIQKGLFCISFFSRAAAMLIARRRLEMSHVKRVQGLRTWPIGEAVMPQEVFDAGMRVEDLLHYCDDLTHYDWAPCFLEREIGPDMGRTFVHPVTDFNSKFISSNCEQDYHCLISRDHLVDGSARVRARAIGELEVYARLYHHGHVYYDRELRHDLLSDARALFAGAEPIAGNVIGGHHEIVVDDLARDLGIDPVDAERVVAPLPSFDRRVSIFLDGGRALSLEVPYVRTTVVYAARDLRLPELVRVRAISAFEAATEIDAVPVLTRRELTFFAVELPPHTHRVVLDAKTDEGVWINYLRLVPPQGSVA